MTGHAVGVEALDPLDPRDRDAFERWVDVHEEADRAVYGDAATTWSSQELRARYRLATDEAALLLVARAGSDVVGAAELRLPRRDNLHRADVWLSVRPGARRRGTGSALLAHAERLARERGRTVLGGESDVPDEQEDPARGFAAARGYAPVQHEVRSELALPVPEALLAALEGEARAAAGGYRVLTWTGDVPAEHLADRAALSRAP